MAIDGVFTKVIAEFLPELADVALNHLLIDVIIKNTVDGVEYLRPCNTSSAIGYKVFKNVLLASRQLKRLASHNWVTSVREHQNISIAILHRQLLSANSQ